MSQSMTLNFKPNGQQMRTFWREGGLKKVMEIEVQVILNLNELLNRFCGT